MQGVSFSPSIKPIVAGLAIALTWESPASHAQSPRLEEVVVTATRRDQSVLDVPYNISVLSSEALRQTGISDISSVVRLVPGLSILGEGPRVSGNRSTYSMRGMNVDKANNNDDNPGISEATVSTYLGEVPVFFPLKLVDIARVEVLRGPQGTLYGAGSVGGTIRFIPEAPRIDQTTLDLMAELSQTRKAGDPSHDLQATLNLPLAEKLAFRGSLGRQYLSGFVDAVGLIQQTGSPRNVGEIVLADPSDILGSDTLPAPVKKDSNESVQRYLRASLLFLPSDTVTATLNFNYQDIEADNRYEHNPNFGDGSNHKTYKAFTDPQDAEFAMLDLDVQVDMGFARLTSATAYSEIDIESTSDSSGFLRTNIPQYYFGNPRVFSPLNRKQSLDTFTQELRLVSATDGAFDWVVGGFYKKEKLDFSMLQKLSGANEYTNLYFGTPQPEDFTDVLADGYTDQEFTDLAAFAELTLHLSEHWQVTGGARVFRQKLRGESGIPLPYASRTLEYYYYGTATDDFLLGGINPTNYRVTENVLKLNTSYDISDDAMVFVTYAEGFRPGGANQLPESDPFGNDNRPFLTYEPDDVKSYEIGVKGSFAQRLSYTLVGFHVDWQDFQATLSSPFGVAFIDNVPGAKSRGIELEVNGAVTDALDVSFGYSWVDAETDEEFLFSQNDPETVIPSGNRLPGVAEHEFFAALNYRLNLAGSALNFHGNVSYRGDSITNFRELPTVPEASFTTLGSYTLWNAAVTWEKDKYAVTLFGDNLSDELAPTSATTASFYGERDQAIGLVRPRTIGLRLRWSYDQ